MKPTNQTLKALRKQRRLTLPAVAEFAGISPKSLADIEAGERTPTAKQLMRLAETYGIPEFALYSESIPNLPETPKDFRGADPKASSISPRGLKALFSAERAAEFAHQLQLELKFSPKNVANEILKANDTSSRATQLRRLFDKWFSSRRERLELSGEQAHQYLMAIRIFFESQGNIVRINDAPASDYIGFFIAPDFGTDTIFVNRSISSKKAQIFTMLHEYCHAICRLEGISNPFQANNEIERQCNLFAAEFLAPMDEFRPVADAVRSRSKDVKNLVNIVSRQTLLSRYATAIRLSEAKFINREQLKDWIRQSKHRPRAEKDDESEENGEQRGGVPHAKRTSELGYLPVYLAYQGVEKKLIDSFDVEEAIGLSRSLQPKAFELAARRMKVAAP
jgi:Zn-dependent peptidase ImmA (M78 family)/DNA-binding XRE family transcriptional regulator